MPAKKRFKTKYPGVCYIESRTRSGKKERIYYVVYRRDGRQIEKKVGRQFKDDMTEKRAATIRAELLEGTYGANKKIPASEKGETAHIFRIPMSKEAVNRRLVEQKWLLFMESATDSFFLYDPELNLVEVNAAGLNLFPVGTEKKDILGKNLADFVPHTKETGEYEAHMRVIRTGQRYEMEDFVPPPPLGPDVYLNIKIFKVGDGVGVIVTDNTDVKRKKKELLKRERELEIKASELEETSTALKVLLARREKDKTELQENMLLNIKELVVPYLEKLKNTKLDRRQESFIGVVESNLKNISSPFVRKISGNHFRLTPMEIQIADLIKQGKITKEIAGLLNLSKHTIESYRKNIRNKMGLRNKKANLRTYLLSTN